LPLRPVARAGALPLSFAQQRLWFLDQLQPDSPLYAMPTALRLNGPLALLALQQSLTVIVARHEVLRTTFALLDQQPIQVIAPAQPLLPPLLDLQAVSAQQREAVALQLLTQEARRPFDLSSGPLLRVTLL